MDPVSIGLTVAVLAGQGVVKKLSGDAASALVRQMVGSVREWFSGTDDDAVAALEAIAVSEAPTDADVAALATLIDERLPAAPKVLAELQPLVDQAHEDPELAELLGSAPAPTVAGRDIITQTAGDGSIQAGRDVHVNRD